MDMEQVIADAKDLCYRVAPAELSGSPLWVVPQTNLPPMLGRDTVCYGYTSPSLDMHLHHTFADWEGVRGPVIVLGNLNIQRDFPQRTYNKLLGTTLHELAHILERPSLFQPRPYNQRYIRAEAIRIAEAVSRDEEGDGTTPPWTTHESRFMRIAYHLPPSCGRSRLRHPSGRGLQPRAVRHVTGQPLSTINTVAQAIKPEADALCAASFRQICSQPVTPGFKAIYEADKRSWINSHHQRQRNHDEFDITT
ncbi:hypothetical protein CA13_62320 [Planctomycetes bacterium CA13]|uniref:Uncharacterized protein n=1 Tax=Novipirellula herctigrandis TaxID=2527986 RepID=A0A5C5ZBR4_9BACT|nr:hypothetical protein CA13_62320 [Planctomycetes bacterium CA13]